MRYNDILGHGYDRKFVVVNDNDGLLIDGIYDDFEKAVGSVMTSIWEMKDSYKCAGDEFQIGDLEDDENGVHITIRFKYHTWENAAEETWYILFYDKRKKKWDKPKGGKK